jgi:predicted transcriptional regulator
MAAVLKNRSNLHGSLDDYTAADLMTANPASIREDATLAEAVRFLTDKGVSGAMVISEAGRPVGVISTSDILIHDRERLGPSELMPLPLEVNASLGEPSKMTFGPTIVSAVMTPIVFTVRAYDAARKVIEQMIAFNVHRLFVVDETEVVIGVISALDVLRVFAR